MSHFLIITAWICFYLPKSLLFFLFSNTMAAPWLTRFCRQSMDCGGKPCPDHGSIRYHWWSSGQDLCFWCSGSPSGEGSIPGRGRIWSDLNNPPKWWPRHDIQTSCMLQGLWYNHLSHLTGALALILAATCIPLCFPPYSTGVFLSISLTSN